MKRALWAIVVGVMALPAWGDGLSGAYLAARQAQMRNDFSKAAEYYTVALTRDPSNSDLMEELVAAHIANGDLVRAAAVGAKLEADGAKSQLAQLALAVKDAKAKDFAALVTRVDDGRHMGELLDLLLKAWALIGEGDMRAALAEFDKVISGNGMQAFGKYHKAMALAYVGDFNGAKNLMQSPEPGSLLQTRRGIVAQMQVLSQLGEAEAALQLLEESFGAALDPELEALRVQLEAGGALGFETIKTPLEGVAEIYYTIAGALAGDMLSADPLIFAQAAHALAPENVDATLLIAQLFEGMDQFDAATKAYRAVPSDHPAYHVAEMGRAETLRQAEKQEAAIEVMEQLAKTHGDLPLVHSALGDLMRGAERFEEAVGAYDRALELRGGAEVARDWRTLYTRGIVNERLGRWGAAEADFRLALEIRPDEPNVLNYLGYSLVEKQLNLDEALEMIRRAVAARPQSGYIIDSLGWALFRLGRYEEAVPHMERAAALMSIDPVVNDHLGDVYWAVGRKLEAEFQWKRALSFIDHGSSSQEADPERIRRKLDVGLDELLHEEGAVPLAKVGEKL